MATTMHPGNVLIIERDTAPNPFDAKGDDRLALIKSMRELGESLEGIGQAFGITRERARQLCNKAGAGGLRAKQLRNGNRGADMLVVLRIVRRPSIERIADVAEEMRTTVTRVEAALQEAGRLDAVRRLFTWRRNTRQGGAYRARGIRQLRAFYETHGRSPTGAEMGTKAGVRKRPDLPLAQYLGRFFGSVPAAFAAAGIPSRPRGAHGHLA